MSIREGRQGATRTDGGGSPVFASGDMTDGPGRGTRPSVASVTIGEVAAASLRGSSDTGPSSAAASPLWTCDGYPTCRFDGTRTDVRNHMRACPESEAGQLFRVLAWAGAQR